MEAAAQRRDLSGDKAQRIIDAMRTSVAARGAAGSTFDHVARQAGVSRGLLHYYFGAKEQLLVEVVRRDCDLRMEALDAALDGARTAEDFIDALVRSLDDLVRNAPDFMVLVFELFVLARRNDEIATEVVELFRRTGEHVAGQLRAKQDEGVIALGSGADAAAEVLFALADGLAMRMLLEPERDFGPTVAAGIACARALLADPTATSA